MNNTKVFWGTFLITLGVLFLMFQLDWINGGLDFMLNLWPLLIILWGVSLLNIAAVLKRILVAISAILLSFIIVALFSAGTSSIMKIKFWDRDHHEVKIEEMDKEYFLEYDANKHDTISLELEAGAGEFEIGQPTDKLAKVHAKGVFTDISLDYYEKENELEIEFDEDGDIKIDLDGDGISRSAYISLNPDVIWDMDFDVGASSFHADLTNYQVRELNVGSGAAEVDIKIGDLYESVRIFVDAGVSSVKLAVPESFGCEIYEDTGLSGLDFDNFIKEKSGVYRTGNFDDSDKKIYIEIDGGISDFNIKRYNQDKKTL